MSKPSPKPFRPKSGKLAAGQDPAPEPKLKLSPKWCAVLGGVLGFLYLYFVVYGGQVG